MVFSASSEEITNGPIRKVLLVVAVPLMAQNAVGVVQQLADLYWLGRLSGDAVAAAGLASPFIRGLAIIATSIPFLGTLVLVSQRVGSDEFSFARRTTFVGLLLAVLLGGAVSLTAVLFAPAAIELLVGLRPDGGQIDGLETVYLRIVGGAIVVGAMSDAIEAGFVGWGDSRTALWINVVAVGVNVALDPILIFGLGPVPALGIRGAALATAGGYLAGLTTALVAVRLAPTDEGRVLTVARPSRADVRSHVEVGAPRTGERVLQFFARLTMTVLVFLLGGPAGVAAFVVGVRTASLASIPARGIREAVQTIVGQNLGADDPGRANTAVVTGVSFAVGTLVAIAVGQWLFARPLTNLLAPTLSPEATSAAVTFFRILAINYPFVGIYFMWQAAFAGAGLTTTNLVVTLLEQWAVRIPVTVLGGMVVGYGLVAAFWAVALSTVLAAVGFGLYYRRSVRRRKLSRAVVGCGG